MTPADQGEPVEPVRPPARARWSLATRARIALTVGLLLALVAPTVAASLEHVSAGVLGLTSQTTPAPSPDDPSSPAVEQTASAASRVSDPLNTPSLAKTCLLESGIRS